MVAVILCGFLFAQEGPGPKPSIHGRQTFPGTLSPTAPTKSFSLKLPQGLYRLTYSSGQTSSVLQVSTDGAVIAQSSHAQPFATLMRVVNGQFQGTTDLPPTGLCSSDVSPDGACAGQKLHFRLSREALVSIKVTGKPKGISTFKLLLDPLQTAPVPDALQANAVFNAYLAFNDGPTQSEPTAAYQLRVVKGQTIGILVGSPDFTSVLDARGPDGKLAVENSGFNEMLDPCREIRIDRLPKFDPYSQTDSYITIAALEDTVFTIHVRARFAGETGLYILRTFELTDSRIEPKQMRSGVLIKGTRRFTVAVPAGWQPEGSRIIAYSPLPITMVLTDALGKPLATSVTQERDAVQAGVQTSQISQMYSTAIDLDQVQAASLPNARIEVTGENDVPNQMFLVGLAAYWGSCGGGAVDPVATVYPVAADFKDRGYPIEVSQISIDRFEASLYSVARGSLKWYFLLQSLTGDKSDPAELVSNYFRLVPEHVPLTDLLVDYEIALRVQLSPTTGAVRVWTRVQRRGYKEKQWQMDLSLTAKTQQTLADQLRDVLVRRK